MLNKVVAQQNKSNKQNYCGMSIYSGFATRQQQQTYDQLVEDVLFVFQKRLLKFYNNETADENKFLDVLIQLHQQMAKMQENKYLEPKSSRSIEDLLRHLLKSVAPGQDATNKNIKPAPKDVTKDVKQIGVSVPMLKSSKVDPNHTQQRLKSNRDSFTKLHEPTSIGKIIKQFNNDTSRNNANDSNNSLADSRNTFINQNKFNTANGSKTPSMKNPEEHEDHIVTEKPNTTQVQFKSRFKGSQPTGEPTKDSKQKDKQRQTTRDYLLEYLQKNNKNYLRGYRKRQVKTRNYSKQYSGFL